VNLAFGKHLTEDDTEALLSDFGGSNDESYRSTSDNTGYGQEGELKHEGAKKFHYSNIWGGGDGASGTQRVGRVSCSVCSKCFTCVRRLGNDLVVLKVLSEHLGDEFFNMYSQNKC